jgi:hypothetical protein
LTTSTHIVPVYRALTIAGNVLDKDEFGEVYHTLVVDTTLEEQVVLAYDLT